MKLYKLILLSLFYFFSVTPVKACVSVNLEKSNLPIESKKIDIAQPVNSLGVTANLMGLGSGFVLLNSLGIVGGSALLSAMMIVIPILSILTVFFMYRAIVKYKDDKKKRRLSAILSTLSGILGLMCLFILL